MTNSTSSSGDRKSPLTNTLCLAGESFDGMYSAISSISMNEVYRFFLPPLCSPNWDIYEVYREVVRHAIDTLYFKLSRRTFDGLSRVFGMNAFTTDSFLNMMPIIHENMMLPVGLDVNEMRELIEDNDITDVLKTLNGDSDAIRRAVCFAIRSGNIAVVRSFILAYDLVDADKYNDLMLDDMFPIQLCFASPCRELWQIGMDLFDSVLRPKLIDANVELINVCRNAGNIWMLEHILTTIPLSLEDFTNHVKSHEHEYNRLDNGLLTILLVPKMLNGIWFIHEGAHKLSFTDEGYSIVKCYQQFGALYYIDADGYPQPTTDTAKRLRSRIISFNAMCKMASRLT